MVVWKCWLLTGLRKACGGCRSNFWVLAFLLQSLVLGVDWGRRVWAHFLMEALWKVVLRLDVRI